MISWGRVALGTVLPFMFTTYDGATGASEEGSGLAVTDIEIYKAGGGLTQRSSDAGYALLDADGHALDSIVGLAGFSVDTGDNTDAGFFVAGGYYIVVVSSVTVDAQTVNFIAGTFSLGPTLTVAGVEEVDITHLGGTAIGSTQIRANVVQVEGTDATDYFATLDDAILAILGALADGAADGDPTTTDTFIGYIKQIVNVLVGSAGVVTFPAAAAPGNAVSFAEVLRSIYDDTNETQGKLPTNKFMGSSTAADKDDEIDAILADTNELQTDWTNGGRLDLLIDAIKAVTDALTNPATIATAVWAAGTRTLSALGFTLGASDLAANTITAAKLDPDVTTELQAGLATTTHVQEVEDKVDDLPTNAELATSQAAADDATLAAIAALSIPTANQNADALLDRSAGVETNFTLRQTLRLMASVLLGKVSGGATVTNIFRDLNDTKDRVTATVDEDGNRTAVTKDAT